MSNFDQLFYFTQKRSNLIEHKSKPNNNDHKPKWFWHFQCSFQSFNQLFNQNQAKIVQSQSIIVRNQLKIVRNKFKIDQNGQQILKMLPYTKKLLI